MKRRLERSGGTSKTSQKASRLTDHLPDHLAPGLDIIRRLRAEGRETYLVGGVVRDLLLGRAPADLDIVTAAPPDVVAALFTRTLRVGAEFGVVAVILDGHPFQVATFRREGPYLDGRRPSYVEFSDAAGDVKRRDFTINALLYDPLLGEVIDHVGGRADLERQVIRTVGDPKARFDEDRLRMLRAVRLASELGFTIDQETLEAIGALAPKLRAVSAERIHEELVRLLVAPGRAHGVRLLARTGLLAVMLPEVAALADQASVSAEGTYLDRLARTIRALELLRRPGVVLAMATLLSLVAPPEQSEIICRRLRFSNAERRAIAGLVREHTRVADFAAMRASGIRSLLRRVPGADLVELYRVQAAAGGGDRSAYVRAVEVMASSAGVGGMPAPLLTGRDLLDMGYAPGPAFAQILSAVDAASAGGEISSTAEARGWVLARFPAGASLRTVEASPRLDTRR